MWDSTLCDGLLSAHVDPEEQLSAGIKALNSATFRIAGSSTLNSVSNTSEGAADPARRAMRLTQSVSAAGKTT